MKSYIRDIGLWVVAFGVGYIAVNAFAFYDRTPVSASPVTIPSELATDSAQ